MSYIESTTYENFSKDLPEPWKKYQEEIYGQTETAATTDETIGREGGGQMDWQTEYVKELKNDIREIKQEMGTTKKEISDIVNTAMSNIQHLDKQRHDEYLETNRRLDSFITSTGNKMDTLKYWVVGTGLGVITLVLAILKLLPPT